MRTNFTVEDIKNIIDELFNGNLWQSIASKGDITYENPNSEKIVFVDDDSEEKTEGDLAKYLNIKFYSWKERVEQERSPEVFEDWVQSLNFSLNNSYCLIERIDEEVFASQDIDSATYIAKATFLVQADKIKNLEYYVSKIRNKYLGNPQEIQNSYGDIVKAFIVFGSLLYEKEPFMTQVGECFICTANFRISYLTDALTYSDTKIEISLDGDDLYNENGEIVDVNGSATKTKYLEMPVTKATFQNIFISSAVPTAGRPDLTGFITTSITSAKTFSFFDFNKELTNKFNDLFWTISAYKINGVEVSPKQVNIPVFIKITCNGKSYVYKDIIENMQKVITNNDFNVSSVTTKGCAENISRGV